jgi:transposase
MKFVATKTVEQLDLLALHRVRERLMSQRTGIINQICAFLLERDVAVRQGQRFRRLELPDIVAKRCEVLSRCDERIEGVTTNIGALATRDPACERLMTVPGIGPFISSAMVAAIGSGDAFLPRQILTGDRTILGKISKQGNRYLRVLFVQAARVVLLLLKSWDRYGLKQWIEPAKKRLHLNVLATALAHKLARIAWAVLNKERHFEVVRTPVPSPQSA